jgi:hypothetical protein
MRSVATLEDGTALFAPRGELPYDPVADLVQCHLCGEWYRALGPHLRRHGWTADEYRLAVGLSPRRPLATPSVSERHAAIARALLDRDPRVRAGLAAGVERARSGELPAAGTAVMSRELARTQLLELRRRQGRELGRRAPKCFALSASCARGSSATGTSPRTCASDTRPMAAASRTSLVSWTWRCRRWSPRWTVRGFRGGHAVNELRADTRHVARGWPRAQGSRPDLQRRRSRVRDSVTARTTRTPGGCLDRGTSAEHDPRPQPPGAHATCARAER